VLPWYSLTNKHVFHISFILILYGNFLRDESSIKVGKWKLFFDYFTFLFTKMIKRTVDLQDRKEFFFGGRKGLWWCVCSVSLCFYFWFNNQFHVEPEKKQKFTNF
tara:strand:+ start:92 stop:406 length:315 start_codon:yes stop_codon:yes gene_type:complete